MNPMTLVSHPKGTMVSMTDQYDGNEPISDSMGIQVAPLLDKKVLSINELIVITQIVSYHKISLSTSK